MIFLHEISDMNQLSPASPEGIHYAAKQIGDADLLMNDLKWMFVNALVTNVTPAGMMWGCLSHGSVTDSYAGVERDALEHAGYNPIIILQGRELAPFVWGAQFRAEVGGYLQSLRITSNMGITAEFKDYLVRRLWTIPDAVTLQTTIQPPVPAQAPQETKPEPIYRAISARPAQIGLFNRLL